jgi:hypothetical protein
MIAILDSNTIEFKKHLESPALTGIFSRTYPAHFNRLVPRKIRMLKHVTSDLPAFLPRVGLAKAGEVYYASTSRNGAVCAILPGGKMIGVKPDEFEVVEWSHPDGKPRLPMHDSEIIEFIRITGRKFGNHKGLDEAERRPWSHIRWAISGVCELFREVVNLRQQAEIQRQALKTVAASFCPRCEYGWDQAQRVDAGEWCHVATRSPGGVDIPPEPCEATALWEFIRELEGTADGN